MDHFDRRQFLAALTAALAACDKVVVEISGEDGISTDGDGNRFIPPVTDNDTFYVYQVHEQPQFDPETWRLTIADGSGSEIGSIDQDFLDTLTPRDIELTLQCIGATVVSRRIGNAIWTGLPLHEVLDAAGISGPPESCVEVVMFGEDDYDASVPVSDYLDAPIWLIWGMNGEALPFDHGAPARLLIPGRYGIKNLKWIRRVAWSNQVYQGFWDVRNWDHLGAYQVCGFIHYPSWDAQVKGPVEVLGSAFAGRDPIVRVEMTSNGGNTWQDAEIVYSPGADIWTLWRWIFDPKQKGDHEIQVRVTTESGAVTSMDPSGTDPLKGYDGGQMLPLVVT